MQRLRLMIAISILVSHMINLCQLTHPIIEVRVQQHLLRPWRRWLRNEVVHGLIFVCFLQHLLEFIILILVFTEGDASAQLVVSELFLVKILDLLDGGVLSLLADASITDIDALEKLLEDSNGVTVGSRVLLWDSSHHFELLA